MKACRFKTALSSSGPLSSKVDIVFESTAPQNINWPMNPYAHLLGTRDAMEVLRTTPDTLREIGVALAANRLRLPLQPAGWTAGEILCHLADAELAFGFRFRQTLAEEHHTIQPFDQDKWAAYYGGLDGSAALEAFSALRRWNLLFLEAVPAGAFSKPVTHPERGALTFEILVATLAGHDLNHLRQLEELISRHEP